MRKLREVIRLRLACGLSRRAIAQSCRLSVSTVSGYLGRVAVAKLGWPLPAALDDDTVLERLLFPDEHHPVRTRPEPDWAAIHRELRRPHVTKQLLWQEYREQSPDGYQYSQFCARYAAWANHLGSSDFIQSNRIFLSEIFEPILSSTDGSETYQNVSAQLFGDPQAGGMMTYLGGTEVLAVQGGGGPNANLTVAQIVSAQQSTDCGSNWSGGTPSSLLAYEIDALHAIDGGRVVLVGSASTAQCICRTSSCRPTRE